MSEGHAICLSCGALFARTEEKCPECGAGGSEVDRAAARAAARRAPAPLAKVIDLALERAKKAKSAG